VPTQTRENDDSTDYDSEGEDDVFDERCVPETDGERLKIMQDSMGGEDLEALRDGKDEDDFLSVAGISGTFTEPSGAGGTADDGQGVRPSSSRTPPPTWPAVRSRSFNRYYVIIIDKEYFIQSSKFQANGGESGNAPGQKRELGSGLGPADGRERAVEGATNVKRRRLESAQNGVGSAQSFASGPGSGAMVDAEMRHRKREALGMDRGRRLGGGMAVSRQGTSGAQATCGGASQVKAGGAGTARVGADRATPDTTQQWPCPRCTLLVHYPSCLGVADTMLGSINATGSTCTMCDGPRL
jgi:hypothetical protein